VTEPAVVSPAVVDIVTADVAIPGDDSHDADMLAVALSELAARAHRPQLTAVR
jgi:hypothetical protein